LDLILRGRYVLADEAHGLLHVVFELGALLLSDPAAQGPAFLWFWSGLEQGDFLHFPIGTVIAAFLLARLLITLEADDGGFNPFVLTENDLAGCECGLERGYALGHGRLLSQGRQCHRGKEQANERRLRQAQDWCAFHNLVSLAW